MLKIYIYLCKDKLKRKPQTNLIVVRFKIFFKKKSCYSKTNSPA
jgi:hypothetical protein